MSVTNNSVPSYIVEAEAVRADRHGRGARVGGRDGGADGVVGAHHLPVKGKIHRVDPDFGSSLTVVDRDSQSNCWINWKIMGQPWEFQV